MQLIYSVETIIIRISKMKKKIFLAWKDSEGNKNKKS